MLKKWEVWWLLWFPVFTSLLSVFSDNRESHLDLTLQVIVYLSRPSAGHLSKWKRKKIIFLNPPENLETPSNPTYPAISGSAVCMVSFLVAMDLNKPHSRLRMLRVLKLRIGKNFYKYLCWETKWIFSCPVRSVCILNCFLCSEHNKLCTFYPTACFH